MFKNDIPVMSHKLGNPRMFDGTIKLEDHVNALFTKMYLLKNHPKAIWEDLQILGW